MRRVTLKDFRTSRGPGLLGLCVDDTPNIAAYVNQAQDELMMLSGETGFWGGWERYAFGVLPSNPYLTLPSRFVRAINLDVCSFPIVLNNEFYEFLEAGPGLQPSSPDSPDWCGKLAGFEKGAFPTMVDLTATNQKILAYLTDVRDGNVSVTIRGLDQNGNRIYTTGADGLEINGFQLDLTVPFVSSAFVVTKIEGIIKPVTYGDVLITQQDQTTFNEVTLARIEARETSPLYRRYYIKRLPGSCCLDPTTGKALITALCKLEYQPAIVDTDFLMIQNIPALIEECMSIRYRGMDIGNAQALAQRCHAKAISLLRGQQRHTMGEQRIAVTVDSLQGAPLENRSIGTLI